MARTTSHPGMKPDTLDVSDIVEIGDQYYILATSILAQHQDRVLKHDDTFALFDRFGDIKPVGRGEEGLFSHGTRFLSRLLVRVGRDRPMLLSSRVKEDNGLLAIDLTNFDVAPRGKLEVQRGTVYLARTILLWDGVCYERLSVRNFSRKPVELELVVSFDADYMDIFEVRGLQRRERGTRLPTRVDGNVAVLGYRGLDGVERRTRITVTPPPAALHPGEARLPVRLEPRGEVTYWLTVACELAGQTPTPLPFATALDRATECLQNRSRSGCGILTSNEQFNDWLSRSRADLALMITDTADGPYPYAGIPWFSTPFGRDALITALESLWVKPDLARGVLRFLALRQADRTIPVQDAQPGKILHELRSGEMAALGEVPFAAYYGSHDSTPLFVMLAAAYYERTGDRAFTEWIWPHVERALGWIERDADPDGDGFLEYLRQSPEGLVQQGWKDSSDSVWHQDGHLAEGSIALCELQAYAYASWRGGAELARALGLEEAARRYDRKAEQLRERFESVFWSEPLGTYALALDGQKRPCLVRSSNAGHTLLCGIASPRAGCPGDPDAARGRQLLGLGNPDRGEHRSPLQPDVLPQRIGLAPRQRVGRFRDEPVRISRGGAHPAGGPVRREPVRRAAPASRAVLRVPSARRRRADALPGGLLAAELGRGGFVPPAPGRARPRDPRPGTPGSPPPRQASSFSR